MKYLIDTNVLSELRRPRQADAGLLRWAAALDPSDAFVSVVTILELERGAVKAFRNQPEYARSIFAWLQGSILPTYAGRILPVDIAVASRCAQFGQIPDKHLPDALIAATALINDQIIVTRNVKDFMAFDVPLINPWTT